MHSQYRGLHSISMFCYTITMKSTKKQSNVALEEINKLFQALDTQTILVLFFGRSDTKKNPTTLTPNVSTIKPHRQCEAYSVYSVFYTHKGAAKID